MCLLVVGESKKRHPRHENTIMMKMDNNASNSYSLDKKQTRLPTSRRWNKSRQITVYVGFGCCRGGVATELARGALHVPLSRVSKKNEIDKVPIMYQSINLFPAHLQGLHLRTTRSFSIFSIFSISWAAIIHKNHNMALKGEAMKGKGLEQSDCVYSHLRPRTGQVLPHLR